MADASRDHDPRFDLVVVANRLPLDLDDASQGRAVWKRSPGGLVTALEPVLRSERGSWVGWPGTADRALDPFVHAGLHMEPVPLSEIEVEEYYEGFSNGTLWPLYHDASTPPTFDRQWWNAYCRVNARFAQAAADVAAPNATVWVQDYQLQLVPKMLREIRPDVTIGFFLHIPFPPREVFLQLPSRRHILEGLLGADLVGFQLPGDVENFRAAASAVLGNAAQSPSDGIGQIQVGDRAVRVGAFPISADSSKFAEQARSAPIRERAQQIRRLLGDPETVLLGVDRLDYTKGIGVRLDAVGGLYDDGRLEPGRHAMVQIATPSREQIDQYAQMRTAIETKVGHLNGTHGQLGVPAVHYLYQGVAREELIALFVAADVMVVTPLRDGMNLVAKEYVACHPEGDGALVLSEFAGAAAELHDAYLVNPYDVDLVKEAIAAALKATPAERRRRMTRMHCQVLSHDVHHWAQLFLETLAAAPATAKATSGISDTAELPHLPAHTPAA